MTTLGEGLASRPVRRAARSLFSAALLMIAPARGDAQVFQLEAGSSTLFTANGGTVEARTADARMLVSAGRLHNDFVIGSLFQKKVRGVTTSIGDGLVNFDLPSDLFGGGHYLPLRGARVDRDRSDSHLSAFGGFTSTSLGAPFFRGGTWGQPLGMLSADRTVSPRWRIFSRNAFSTRQTSIQGAEWLPRESLRVALAAGVGSNRPYGAVSATFDRHWAVGQAAYASHPAGFRRVEIDSPMASEVERENVSLTLRPDSHWGLNVMRQNLVQDPSVGNTPVEVTVNQLGGSLNAGRFRIASSLFESSGHDRESLGTSATVGRQIGNRLDVAADYFRYSPRGDRRSSSGVVTIREVITTRLSLLQLVTRSNRQTAFNLGGEFLSNPVTVTVSYQTIYAPLRIGNPFVQVIGVELHVHGPVGLSLQAGTYAMPDGQVRYTISGNRILSRSGRHDATGDRMAKYQIRGLVLDEETRPVSGAVVRVNEDIVITDDEGRFSLRTNRGTQVKIAVLTDEFTGPGRFEIVSAPAVALPAIDGTGSGVTIVVRRR